MELRGTRRALDNMHRMLVAEKARVRVRSRTAAGKAATKRGRAPKMPRIDVGDFVLVALPEKRAHKLEFNWQGPYVVKAPRMTESPVRSAQGEPHIDVSSHVFVVHLVDDEDNTMDVHVSRMRRFSAKTMGTNVDIDELARHDLQQLEVEEF